MRKALGGAQRGSLSTVAVFIALGGSGYAAVTLPHNSVGVSQIKPSAVTGSEVKNGSLGRGEFKSGTLVRGQRGLTGPTGATGPAGISSIIAVNGAVRSYPSGDYGAPPSAFCPAGSVVVGTGFNGPFNEVGGFVKAYGTFVGGFFENDSLITVTGSVQAVCARVTTSAAASIASRRAADLRRFRGDVAAAERRFR